MNWFKNLFSLSKKRTKYLIPNNEIPLANYLDIEFINYLYFNCEQLKIDYINNIKKILETTIENSKIERNKVLDYITNNEINIPFMMEAIKFDEYNGNFKLKKYYTALNVSKHNIKEKINNKIYCFKFEEELALNAFKADYRNYARIETLFILGEAFLKANELEKSSLYFNIIYKDKYDLSEVTVSSFHRKIGNIYLDIQEEKKALKWYKSGLQLNSKLGVKKLIESLEK